MYYIILIYYPDDALMFKVYFKFILIVFFGEK